MTQTPDLKVSYEFTHSKELILGSVNRLRILGEHFYDLKHILDLVSSEDFSREDLQDLKQKASFLREKLELNKHEYHEDYHEQIETYTKEFEARVEDLVFHHENGNHEEFHSLRGEMLSSLKSVEAGLLDHRQKRSSFTEQAFDKFDEKESEAGITYGTYDNSSFSAANNPSFTGKKEDAK